MHGVHALQEPKGKKKSVPSYMSNTASSASKRSNNSSLDAAFNSTPANPRPARRTAAHSASPSRMGAFAKAAAPPKGGVSASPSRMGGTLESVRPSAAAPSRRTTTGGAYAARGSRTRSGSGASPSSEGYRYVSQHEWAIKTMDFRVSALKIRQSNSELFYQWQRDCPPL